MGERVGKLEIPGADLHPPLPHEVQELLSLFFGPVPEVVLKRPGDLDIPAEFRVVGIAVRFAAVLDDIVQVLRVLFEDPGLELRVADIGVGMMEKVDRPMARGRERFLGGGGPAARLERKGRDNAGLDFRDKKVVFASSARDFRERQPDLFRRSQLGRDLALCRGARVVDRHPEQLLEAASVPRDERRRRDLELERSERLAGGLASGSRPGQAANKK